MYEQLLHCSFIDNWLWSIVPTLGMMRWKKRLIVPRVAAHWPALIGLFMTWFLWETVTRWESQVEGKIGKWDEDGKMQVDTSCRGEIRQPHRQVEGTPTTEIDIYLISKINWRGHYWLLTVFRGTLMSNQTEALSAAELIYCNDFPQLGEGLQSRMIQESDLLLVAATLLKDLWVFKINVVASSTETFLSVWGLAFLSLKHLSSHYADFGVKCFDNDLLHALKWRLISIIPRLHIQIGKKEGNLWHYHYVLHNHAKSSSFGSRFR